MLTTEQEKTGLDLPKNYMKIDTDSSTGTIPPPPTDSAPRSSVSSHQPLETAKMNIDEKKGEIDTTSSSTSSIQYMTQKEIDEAGFEPQTPEDTPPMTEFEPKTPEDTPPKSVTNKETQQQTSLESSLQEVPVQNMDGIDEEKQEDVVDEEKEKQLELLKQTYLDITKKKMSRQKNIFCPVIDTEKVVLPVNQLDKNYQVRLKSLLKKKLEEKCNKHGFIKEGSVNVISISSTNVYGKSAEFYVTYQALSCNPVEGMIVEASVLNITKAGIRAELINFDKSPLVIFIARDHHNNSNYFNNLKEGDTINVTIIGVQYELHDKFISVIGELHRM